MERDLALVSTLYSYSNLPKSSDSKKAKQNHIHLILVWMLKARPRLPRTFLLVPWPLSALVHMWHRATRQQLWQRPYVEAIVIVRDGEAQFSHFRRKKINKRRNVGMKLKFKCKLFWRRQRTLNNYWWGMMGSWLCSYSYGLISTFSRDGGRETWWNYTVEGLHCFHQKGNSNHDHSITRTSLTPWKIKKQMWAKQWKTMPAAGSDQMFGVQ